MLVNKRNYLYILLLIALLSIVGSWLLKHRRGGEGELPMQVSTGKIFGTTYTIKYRYERTLDQEIVAILDAVDCSLSLFNQGSTLSRINDNASVETDTLLREVVRLSAQVSEQTGGAFDITVAPLTELWGFGPEGASTTEPTCEEVDSLRQLVGMDKLQFEGTWLHKASPGVRLDCGAVAKGFGVDCVARQLIQCYGIQDFMVEIGGEIVTHGVNANGEPWRIGISRPVEGETTQAERVLALTNAALATSGDYLNYHVDTLGHKVAHTIDPRTGYPARADILSATVIAEDCATADAYATAFMVMGLHLSREFLESHPELQALLIYADPDSGELFVDDTYLRQ